MAHTKSGGSKARQGENKKGKRLGVKVYGGQPVKTGGIIVRQRGTIFHAGDGTRIGRDHTLFAIKRGIVRFTNKTRSKKEVSVI